MAVAPFRQRVVHKDISGSTVLATGDNLSASPRTLVTGKSKHTIYIQRIVVHVLVDNAATQTFQDTSSGPLVIAGTKASPGIGPIVFDFGAEGRALTEDKDFQLKNSGAGLGADIHWEGYMRQSGVMSDASFASV